MEIIQKEVLCRVSRSYIDGALSIRGLGDLYEEIAHSACRQLCMKPKDIHDKTTVAKKFSTQSITGDGYLSEKILKMKIAIVITECELIDDIKIKKRKDIC